MASLSFLAVYCRLQMCGRAGLCSSSCWQLHIPLGGQRTSSSSLPKRCMSCCRYSRVCVVSVPVPWEPCVTPGKGGRAGAWSKGGFWELQKVNDTLRSRMVTSSSIPSFKGYIKKGKSPSSVRYLIGKWRSLAVFD